MSKVIASVVVACLVAAGAATAVATGNDDAGSPSVTYTTTVDGKTAVCVADGEYLLCSAVGR